MIDAILSYFIRTKPAKRYESPEHIESLKETWESLDAELKDFATTTRDLGLGYNLKARLNQKGMAELVSQLDDVGYEIRKKRD